jgi:serine/threonine-protein kinase
VGSTVELLVSTGKVAMPELRGMTRAEAEAALKELGLVAVIREMENSQVQPGKVTAQSDPLNSLVEQGKAITVTVATAPAPEPTPTPTPTATATPSPTKGK